MDQLVCMQGTFCDEYELVSTHIQINWITSRSYAYSASMLVYIPSLPPTFASVCWCMHVEVMFFSLVRYSAKKNLFG